MPAAESDGGAQSHSRRRGSLGQHREHKGRREDHARHFRQPREHQEHCGPRHVDRRSRRSAACIDQQHRGPDEHGRLPAFAVERDAVHPEHGRAAEQQRQGERRPRRRLERDRGAMKTGHRQRRARRREQGRQTADEEHPWNATGQRRARDARNPRDGARQQMVREREKGDKRPVGRVGLVVDAELAIENRRAADDAAVDDRRLSDGERLRHREIARIDQMLRLKVRLELVRDPERISR